MSNLYLLPAVVLCTGLICLLASALKARTARQTNRAGRRLQLSATLLLTGFVCAALSFAFTFRASESAQQAERTSVTAEVSIHGENEPNAERQAKPEADIPPYSKTPYIELSDNVPSFTEDEMTDVSFEIYGDLDELGRCTGAVACIGPELMPTGERGEIGSVKPSGWHLVKYDGIDGNYLYNRCHLIGYQLTGENANEKNLITGTRYLNTEGMLPFENETADYIRRTGNHVLYRVTPIFDGDNLLADGVLMEARSVEDGGKGVCFRVFCYNVQPGIAIDYATGESHMEAADQGVDSSSGESDNSAAKTYILNTNTHKFHEQDCSSVQDMKEKNKKKFTGTRDEVIGMGYEPCGRCNP